MLQFYSYSVFIGFLFGVLTWGVKYLRAKWYDPPGSKAYGKLEDPEITP